MDKRNLLIGRVNSFNVEALDVFRGIIDLKRSLKCFRPKKHSLWRYQPEVIDLLSKRLEDKIINYDFDTFFQFGVCALPNKDCKVISHIEIPVSQAINSKIFSLSYGFSGHSKKIINKALQGEKKYIDRNDLIWTNTNWTAQKIVDTGVSQDKIFIYPPCVAMADPGRISRDWQANNILFVGKDWKRKGGPLLLAAFKKVKKYIPNSSLTIIGCTPDIREKDVNVLGFLNKDIKSDYLKLKFAYEQATLFCLPSYWESTGIVYFEAALFGLPLVMLSGQGREELFKESFARIIQLGDEDKLSNAILEIFKDNKMAESMGQNGRKIVLENYTYPILVDKLINEIDKI